MLCRHLKSASLQKWLEKALDTLQDLKKSKLAPGYNAALIMLPCLETLERRAKIQQQVRANLLIEACGTVIYARRSLSTYRNRI